MCITLLASAIICAQANLGDMWEAARSQDTAGNETAAEAASAEILNDLNDAADEATWISEQYPTEASPSDEALAARSEAFDAFFSNEVWDGVLEAATDGMHDCRSASSKFVNFEGALDSYDIFGLITSPRDSCPHTTAIALGEVRGLPHLCSF